MSDIKSDSNPTSSVDSEPEYIECLGEVLKTYSITPTNKLVCDASHCQLIGEEHPRSDISTYIQYHIGFNTGYFPPCCNYCLYPSSYAKDCMIGILQDVKHEQNAQRKSTEWFNKTSNDVLNSVPLHPDNALMFKDFKNHYIYLRDNSPRLHLFASHVIIDDKKVPYDLKKFYPDGILSIGLLCIDGYLKCTTAIRCDTYVMYNAKVSTLILDVLKKRVNTIKNRLKRQLKNKRRIEKKDPTVYRAELLATVNRKIQRVINYRQKVKDSIRAERKFSPLRTTVVSERRIDSNMTTGYLFEDQIFTRGQTIEQFVDTDYGYIHRIGWFGYSFTRSAD